MDGLRRYARTLTRNSSELEDLVQESIARALSTAHLWPKIRDLRAYLFTILHHLHVDACMKRTGQRAEFSIDLISDPIATPAAQDDRLALRDLARALALLPDAQKQVINLIAFEGLSYDEAATRLRVPIGTVMSRLFRARGALRKTLMDFRMGSEPKTPGNARKSALRVGQYRYQGHENARTE
jgi:RNA polymerase sigma-70 factor (ECF subfamily)